MHVEPTQGRSVPLPLIVVPVVLIGTGVVTGLGGTALSVKGAYNIKRANGRVRRAGLHYSEERATLEAHEVRTNDSLKALGARQEDAYHVVVERMVDFLRLYEKLVSESEKLLADGLESATDQVTLGDGLGQDAIAWMRGMAGAVVAGVGINAGLTTVVTSFATASTGTAISTLSGAAATNATAAFFGGGSIAAGGGGMAVGAAALNFVTIGPAILVTGFVVAGQGEKAKTKASEDEAAVNIAIAEMHETKAKFDAVITRADELGTLLDQLVRRATSALDLLESEAFEPSQHAARFQRALTLTMAVRDIAATSVVDESGDLSEDAATFKLRYRSLIKEIEDV